jgi:hypothetical protein
MAWRQDSAVGSVGGSLPSGVFGWIVDGSERPGSRDARAADDWFKPRMGRSLAAVGGCLGPSGRSFGFVAERLVKASRRRL